MDSINKCSKCANCGTTFVYKKKTKRRCIRTKVVYELKCPNCYHKHSKDQLNNSKISKKFIV